jgi:monoamine oxidase
MAAPMKHISSSTDAIRNVDVVVVGAGLSGLTAALDIQKAGFTAAVLEARDRVGGKTLSKSLASGKGYVDVGAAWLKNTTQPKIYTLAKKYGFDTVVQPTEGDEVLQDRSRCN